MKNFISIPLTISLGFVLVASVFMFPASALADDNWFSETYYSDYNPSSNDGWNSETYYSDYNPSSNDGWNSETYYSDYNPDSGYGASSYSLYGPSSYSYTPPSSSYAPQYYQTDYSYYPDTYYGGGYSSQPIYYQTDYSYFPNTYSGSSYDYAYDYVYDYTYEEVVYEWDDERYDHCSNIRGDQPRGYDCYPDRDHDDDEPRCELTASDRTVEEGDRITLEWETDNADYASINQGIGRVDEDGGEERVRIDGDTTFRMTVRDNDGDEDTCSVTVRADDEDENDFSSVSFVGEPTYNPPVVYLSDIPYTGVEDIDPVLLSYWLMLIAAGGAGAWYLYRAGMIPTFAFASADPSTEGDVEDIAEGGGHVAPEVDGFLSALASGDTEGALNYVREAAATGTGVEEFLTEAERVATDAVLQSRVSSALAESRETGVLGVKKVLAA